MSIVNNLTVITDIEITKQWLKKLRDTGFTFPNTYVVFDMETTGLDPNVDLAVQIGYLFVENGKIIGEPSAAVLDWTSCRRVDQTWLTSQLFHTGARMNSKGNGYKFSYETIQKGTDPIKCLRGYLNAFRICQKVGVNFVAHNGYRYDTRMMENHFNRFLNSDFRFDNNKMIDTGLFEKASQQSDAPLPLKGDSLVPFYCDVADLRSKVSWSLSRHCTAKYDLINKYNLDMSKAHTADFDCYVTHLLYQEYRQLALGL